MLVRSPKDVRRLMAEIYRDTRDYPIVGLALRGGEAEPALRPREVRAVADEETRIYLIVGDYLLRRLQKTQGTELSVARGVVWVWWPGWGAQGVDHDASRSIALQQFARELELSRPVARSEIERLADARASLECELAEARESNSGLKRDLRATELDELRATARAEAAEQRLEESQTYLESFKDAGLDDDELRMIVQMNPEDRLHRLRAWACRLSIGRAYRWGTSSRSRKVVAAVNIAAHSSMISLEELVDAFDPYLVVAADSVAGISTQRRAKSLA